MAVGLDGLPKKLCQMARQDSGCEVWRQDFPPTGSAAERFDGIFANATLFHNPQQEAAGALRAVAPTACEARLACCSAPTREVRIRRLDRWIAMPPIPSGNLGGAFMQAAGLSRVEHYYVLPACGCEQQPCVWQTFLARA